MLRAALLLASGLLLTTPAALAFHGASYHATGNAVGPDGTVYNAIVDWCGYDAFYASCGAPPESFRVQVLDMTSGAVLVDRAFRGAEQFYSIPTYGGNELFLYEGKSLDASVSFDVKGFVYNKLTSPPASHMLYEGNYEAYTLVLVVDQAR